MCSDSAEIKLKFDGPTFAKGIDVYSAKEILNCYINLLKISDSIIFGKSAYSENKLLTVLNNCEEFCFIHKLPELIQPILPLMPDIKNSLSIVVDWFKIIYHLKGESPTTISEIKNKIEIRNNSGNIITADSITYNSYNNFNIPKRMEKLIIPLKDNDDLIDITSNSEKVAIFKSSDRAYFQNYNDNQEMRITEIKEDLIIRSPIIYGGGKWGFMFRGRVISAEMIDERLKKAVNDREISFASGDKLRATLRIEQEMNKAMQVKTKYSVVNGEKID
jgi:hypothetical protein